MEQTKSVETVYKVHKRFGKPVSSAEFPPYIESSVYDPESGCAVITPAGIINKKDLGEFAEEVGFRTTLWAGPSGTIYDMSSDDFVYKSFLPLIFLPSTHAAVGKDGKLRVYSKKGAKAVDRLLERVWSKPRVHNYKISGKLIPEETLFFEDLEEEWKSDMDST